GLAIDLHHLLRQLVAYAAFDQDGMRPGAYDDRIQAQRHQVAGVGWQLALPQGFGDDTEHASAIEVINPVGDGGELEVTESDALHGILPSSKSLSLPRLRRSAGAQRRFLVSGKTLASFARPDK